MSSSILDSCSFTHQFNLNYSKTEKAAIGRSVSSGDISGGWHLWKISCYPRGNNDENKGYVSIFLELVNKPQDNVEAIFEASVMDIDGALSSSHRKSLVHVYRPKNYSHCGWSRFVERSVLESFYVTNVSFIIACGVKVVPYGPLKVLPPSDMASHFGLLLDCADGSDVSLVVGGDKFPAHRAVLAARSPVFKAQLLGSMADANLSSITMHDIAPSTFKLMLRFMYTDAFPTDAELGESRDEMLRSLFAAADRFALDRLKLLCAIKMWDDVSVDKVTTILICADTYNCPELKQRCIDFIMKGGNAKKVMLTDGFIQLAQKYPSIVQELREKVGSS